MPTVIPEQAYIPVSVLHEVAHRAPSLPSEGAVALRRGRGGGGHRLCTAGTQPSLDTQKPECRIPVNFPHLRS